MNYEINDDKLSFSVPGNYTDIKGNYYPMELLYNAYKCCLGKEIEIDFPNSEFNKQKRIITNVVIQGDFIWIDTIKMKL